MALRKKYPQILALGADIMVIQECSKMDLKDRNRPEGWSSWWVGENQSKGLVYWRNHLGSSVKQEP